MSLLGVRNVKIVSNKCRQPSTYWFSAMTLLTGYSIQKNIPIVLYTPFVSVFAYVFLRFDKDKNIFVVKAQKEEIKTTTKTRLCLFLTFVNLFSVNVGLFNLLYFYIFPLLLKYSSIFTLF